jgi:MoxR-like ATPase
MLKLKIGYPTKAEERTIIDRMVVGEPEDVRALVTLEQVKAARDAVGRVHLDERIRDYIVEIVHATRDPAGSGARFTLDMAKLIEFGASPRASISLAKAARAYALLEGRGFVTPSDIKSVGMDVLRHRVIVGYEAEAEGVTSEDVVREIFNRIPIP